MATPNIVPRNQGEGGLGTVAKGWGKLFITNTTASSSGQGGQLRLTSDDGAAMGANHRLGVIEFYGAEDASSTVTIGANIGAYADTGWSATENGAFLSFFTTDGNAESTEKFRINASGNDGVTIKNRNVSSSSSGGKLVLECNDQNPMGAGHRLGAVEFVGAEDTGNTLTVGARIECVTSELWNSTANGANIDFITTNGNNTQERAFSVGYDKTATFFGDVDITLGNVSFGGSNTSDYAQVISFGAGYHWVIAELNLTEANETDNGVIKQIPGIKIPQYARVKEVLLTIMELSNLATYNVNLLLGTDDGVSADSVPANPHEILGAGAVQSYWTDDVNGVTDIILGSGSGDLKKNYWQDRSMTISDGAGDGELTADHYVYVCNAGTSNGTTNATAGRVYIMIKYHGMD